MNTQTLSNALKTPGAIALTPFVHTLLSLLLLILMLVITAPALAEKKKINEQIVVQSDSALRDEKSGLTVYEGNVVLKQGALNIQAARIEIHDNGKKITQVIALGNPATFDQSASENQSAVSARCNRLEYALAKNRITFSGNAAIKQGGSELTGERIFYNTVTELVKASGSKQGQSRVRVVLQPELSDNTTETDTSNSNNDQDETE